MKVEKAKTFLENVIQLKQSVPYRRHKKKQAHKKDLKQFKWYAGRYPRKAAARIYEVLSAVESNAEYKGLDIEVCRIIHAATHRGRIIKRYIQRAHGRSSAKFRHLSHVEIVIYEFPS
jgi:large subunit ribosomal protein L22